MKKFIKSFLMAAAALMLLAGCNGLIDATVSGDPDKAVITIGIDGITESANRRARNIDPEAYDTPAKKAASNFVITLSGTSDKGYEKNEVVLDFKGGSNAEIALEYDVWYLTMRAYDKTAPTQLLFEGRKRVDLKNGAPTSTKPLTFNLSTEGVTTPGSISIEGTFTNTLIDATHGLAVKYKAALYDLNTNEIVKFEDDTDSTIETSIENVKTVDGDGNEVLTGVGQFAYSPASGKKVKPGRYNFRIYFYMNKGTESVPDYKPIGTWGDIVVVAPGRSTVKTDCDLGDILMQKPTKPTGLSAYYIKDSADITNYYNVLITWEDKSNNEEYFELTIQDCDGASPVDYKIFGDETDSETVHVKELFWESKNYVAGNLTAGSEYCIVKLPLAKKFDISLKAVNVIGKSVACERVTTNTSAFSSDKWSVPKNVAYGAEKINLMKITYDLNNGVLKTAENETRTGSVNTYEIFKATEGFKIPVMKIETAEEKWPKLEKNHHPFLQWNEITDTTTVSDVKEITTFGNRTLIANYNVLSIVSYTIDDTYGSITATATQASNSVKNGTLSGTSSITFEVADSDVETIKVRFLGLTPEEDKEVVKEKSNRVVFNDVKDLELRTYTVQVIVIKKDGKSYCDVFAITKAK